MASIVVRPAAQLADKFATRAAAASNDYTNGVKSTSKDQAANAIAQKANWIAALNSAAQADRFAKGLAKAGTEKWRMRASTLGAGRFASGVQAAKDAWAAAVQPFFDVLGSLTLPNKLPKGDPGNQARSAAVGAAEHAKKLAG